jgi:heparan-alpha-glucosaminide N-acetyltransferase
MYHHPTCLPDCQYFDPEGTLSTFVATVSIFIGLYFGYHLVHFLDHKSRVLGWVVPSVLMIGAGIGIHFAGMPFNKNLYSIRFV